MEISISMSMIIAALCLLTLIINVVFGSNWNIHFLSDVGEMLMLLAASAFFVIGILIKEADENIKVAKKREEIK